MVLGTFVAAPKAARANPPSRITAATFAGLHAPGFGIAVMNFRLQGLTSTRTRLTSETRVFATDATLAASAASFRIIGHQLELAPPYSKLHHSVRRTTCG